LPTFNLGADAAICQNDTLTLNATVNNATGYMWNSGATTATLKAYQAGIYWCEVSKQGCVFRDSLTITAVKPLPVVSLGNDVAVCEGNTVTLDATYLNSTYLWQDGSTNPIYSVTQQGIYSVQVNLNGCKRSDTISINYNLKPRFTLGPDQAICQGNIITLNPVLNTAWQLSWQDGTSGSSYTVTQPGSYTLSATNNCGSTLDDVVVSPGICKVFVPNAFTPNNDGKNDQFKVLGTEDVTQFILKIFNRWGETVFETNDKSKGWDGYLNGRFSPIGVFIYILNYKDNNSTELKMLKGTLTLIR
jgi:gliding motility-associated-like protein